MGDGWVDISRKQSGIDFFRVQEPVSHSFSQPPVPQFLGLLLSLSPAPAPPHPTISKVKPVSTARLVVPQKPHRPSAMYHFRVFVRIANGCILHVLEKGQTRAVESANSSRLPSLPPICKMKTGGHFAVRFCLWKLNLVLSLALVRGCCCYQC